jgi:hypothetical protein
MRRDHSGYLQCTPLAAGKRLVVAPGRREKTIAIESNGTNLELMDGRGLQNNGWFVVRSALLPGATKNAVDWTITTGALKNWRSPPAIQVSQIGYHPGQRKYAVIELDKTTNIFEPIQLVRIHEDSQEVVLRETAPVPWGPFLRSVYLRFDFSVVATEGLYRIRYGGTESHDFEIRKAVFARPVWQPTLECFLPVQMCHMRIVDRSKVWHGLCHMDDARMAPLNHNHFDGYIQHGSTLTTFAPGEQVPGLNAGGWHDAGDYDLRIESQAETVYKLALAYEFFASDYDETSFDQAARIVTLHLPDGKPDILQQIEHGVLSIVGGYKSMGRVYRGIISPTLKQYTHLGDASTMSDNLAYMAGERDPVLHRLLPADDRWVFTEENPAREAYVARGLAAAHRVLGGHNPELAHTCLEVAEALYRSAGSTAGPDHLAAAAELYLSTSAREYAELLLENRDRISGNIQEFAEVLGRVVKKLNDPGFTAEIRNAVREELRTITGQQEENPYGVPYRPHIWGAGWGIQSFGVKQLILHLGFPDLVSAESAYNALHFVLGCHPGANTASFVSGVGGHSLTVAYGINRDEWSYIPGGVASGTALIRPDLPELKVWPYLWQQTEYVIGGGAVDFLILAMGADAILNR